MIATGVAATPSPSERLRALTKLASVPCVWLAAGPSIEKAPPPGVGCPDPSWEARSSVLGSVELSDADGGTERTVGAKARGEALRTGPRSSETRSCSTDLVTG